jgi:hypothetical protein
METEQIYGLLTILLTYSATKEKDQALEEFLNYVYENDIVDINDLYNYILSNDEEEEWTLKKIKRFIKENDLEDEYDDEEW